MNKIKDILRETFIYRIYLKIKYLLYPIKLKKNRINKTKPTRLAIDNHKKDEGIIISLTTFPGRINIAHKTIYSLMHQTIKPYKIILWLAESQFPQKNKDLPSNLTELEKYGLEIKWTKKDIKSYKKLVPTLIEYPNNIIVTADDDLYYPTNWLESLYKSYLKYPKDIHCHLITRITKENGRLLSIPRKKEYINSSSYSNKILGGSGTLYPPKSLSSEVINSEKFMKISPTSDDIWFWAMAIINGTKIRWIENNMKDLFYTEFSQEETECLWKVNDKSEKLFPKHLNDIAKEYNLYDKISKEG